MVLTHKSSKHYLTFFPKSKEIAKYFLYEQPQSTGDFFLCSGYFLYLSQHSLSMLCTVFFDKFCVFFFFVFFVHKHTYIHCQLVSCLLCRILYSPPRLTIISGHSHFTFVVIIIFFFFVYTLLALVAWLSAPYKASTVSSHCFVNAPGLSFYALFGKWKLFQRELNQTSAWVGDSWMCVELKWVS